MNAEINKPIIVQKYGGSSLASSDLIKRVAKNIIARKDKGVHVIVVVSAMGKTTDHFVQLAREVNPNPSRREMDMLLSVGERVSISLVAMAINALGKYTAVSYTGSQVGIVTDANHTEANILEVKGHRIREALAEDKIVVVAGFQGVSIHKEITTLGRGGSDTTAVALAAILKAEACEIMSDVDGIYTADPHVIPTAKRIDKMHFDEALEMAASGAEMLQRTSVEFAKKHKIKLSLGSSLSGYIGTIVTDENLTKGGVTSVVSDSDFKLIKMGNAANISPIVMALAEHNIRPKFWQATDDKISMVLSNNDFVRCKNTLPDFANCYESTDELSLISIVGAGVAIGSSISGKVARILGQRKVQCFGIQNGDLSIKILVLKKDMGPLLKVFHNAFFDGE